ncbi:polysaccharide biosynthesis protein [Variovorax sp. RA8]|uniref:polysaccharide biosynthesis protein n=1 Tax=Variovorax sp. (strain JCM 16519 / RA8) TaxID=662548 RepID=UPI00131983B8|nr:nucleoside-diphosphate sugar epimerase/dehydratase [Variovorax sp. RA8]VTU37473.1 UDP-N-acetyl-alpha-D-glucosamine C6 dehydratase [Variovorax sp. RA8]
MNERPRFLTRAAAPLLALPRTAKRALVLGMDACLCVFTVWLALSLRFDAWVVLSSRDLWAVGVSLSLALPLFVKFGMYRAIFRYSGWPALAAVTKAVAIYAAAYGLVFAAIGVPGVPRTIGLIQPLLLLLAVSASRLLARGWLGGVYQGLLTRRELPRVLIYGAGDAGRRLAQALSAGSELRLLGFLDDDERLQGGLIHGLPVHDPATLKAQVAALRVSDIFLAIPSVSRQRRHEILEQVRQARVSVRTLPGLMELAQGKVQVSDLRELDVEDLLGRNAVAPHPLLLGKNIRGKVVLVTGAGGSIGSELCRQIVKGDAATLLLVERSEFALYTIHGELLQGLEGRGGDAPRIVPLLASVADARRMREIMAAWHPHTVYHAAAYKHVPLVEHNPAEGVRNNVFGTLITAGAAAAHGVRDFVLISTDKAVRPTNIMGCSKRLAEMGLQALAEQASRRPNGTRFSMVRFGNVLDSSGSVVPLFRQQIRNGGPITLTHLDITRYFMTIPEAAQLVIQAGAMANGGEVFVLDMGEPIRIADLARRMVELSGMTVRDADNPAGDIEIRVVGLRPGEKLYEELLIGDNPLPTPHSRILKARDDFLSWGALSPQLERLKAALEINDAPSIRQQLQQMVLGYRPRGEVVDWVHLEQRAELAVAGL